MFWLEDNDELSMEYMYNAIDKDKKDGVSTKPYPYNIEKRFSKSSSESQELTIFKTLF